ncbi:Coiled-Coil-Helix-Coiled-Coil-Helix Domain-Containing Protein 7 [Manis pentadactyla]|nr:Coiled-Coil-Helix-Coiled-Coil-Helix Domain-Containing Protein 7 [Manis pentadactyla]
MLGCALLKVQLREPLTCLERETAWSLAKRLSEFVHEDSSKGGDIRKSKLWFVFRIRKRREMKWKYQLSRRCHWSKKTVRMPMVSQRLRDPDINPCLSESDASTRCMDENNYDRERCSTYFLKYKNCRKFWNSVMIQRRRNGMKPSMPTAEERDEILGAIGKMPY